MNKLGKLALVFALLLPFLARADIGIGINIGAPAVVQAAPPPETVNAPGGAWYHGYNGNAYGWWWVAGTTWYLYPAPMYPAPDPSVPPITVVNAAPPGYPPGQYWYWCGEPAGYYPYVNQCAVQWQPLTAGPQASQVSAPPPSYDEPPVVSYDQCSGPPPELPDYDQPPVPADGYLWTPGYWACADQGYYWVPGTWVQPPAVGLLWTPGYWGWSNGAYVFNAGYWGPQVGFYGGINYGYGYGGSGYAGGRWNNGAFAYNRTVNNVGGVSVHNSYNETVVNNVSAGRLSFNGGSGGVRVAPTAVELAAARQNHIPATAEQAQHQQIAHTDPAQRAAVNGGHPAVAATARPGVLSGPGVAAARGVGQNNPVPRTSAVPRQTQFSSPVHVPAAPSAGPARPPVQPPRTPAQAPPGAPRPAAPPHPTIAAPHYQAPAQHKPK